MESTLRRAGIPPLVKSKAMAVVTSAKASDASSARGSLAMDGCMASKLISLWVASPLASRCCSDGVSARPGGSRQRCSRNLARPSCSHTGVRSWVTLATA